MSRFRGTLKGNSKELSRLGTKESGLTTTCQGWGEGIKVYGRVNDHDEDCFDIYLIGSGSRLIATVSAGGFVRIV